MASKLGIYLFQGYLFLASVATLIKEKKGHRKKAKEAWGIKKWNIALGFYVPFY